MREYVRIKAKNLAKLYRTMKEKDAYIKKLELALDSVKRQLANIEEKKNVER